MFATSTLLAFSDMGLLAAVVGLYAVLGGLWLVYWVFQNGSKRFGESGRVEQLRQRTLRDIEARGAARSDYSPQTHPSKTESLAPVALDDVAELRAELIAIRETSNKAKSRVTKLEDRVEALRLRVADLEREDELVDEELVQEESAAAAHILSLYEPNLDKYDDQWATTDPDLGVILAKRPDTPDDLTQIWGIGQVNQERLNENGVFYFQQIADWTAHNVDQFNALLAFKGRIEREDWVAQAQRLLSPNDERKVA